MEKFSVYSKQSPVISMRVGAEQVLVAFHNKEEAVLALKENFDSEEFPELHVAQISRARRRNECCFIVIIVLAVSLGYELNVKIGGMQ